MSFLTGRYPHTIDVLGNGDVLDSRIPTFAHMAVGANYRTVLAGRMHFVGPDQYHGFQEHIGSDYTAYAFHAAKINRYNPLQGLLGNGGRPDPLLEVGPGVTCTQELDKYTTRAALDWLGQYESAGGDRPFLMTVGYFSPHCPYIVEEQYFRKYEGRVLPRETTEDEIAALHPYHKAHRQQIEIDRIPRANTQKAAAAYYGLVDFLDDQIGMLMSGLEDLGLADRTAVIYFSDHGEMLGEHGRWHKSTFYEGAARVPLIIRRASTAATSVGASSNAGAEASGDHRRKPVQTPNEVAAPVSLVDIFPTVCELTGADLPVELPGWSLSVPPPPNRPVLCEYHDGFGSHRMVRREQYKLSLYGGFDEYELFDLASDPEEKTNVAGDPHVAEVERELRDVVFDDGFGFDIESRHRRRMSQIGYDALQRSMSKTQALIENGTIREIPGYDTVVSGFENRLDD